MLNLIRGSLSQRGLYGRNSVLCGRNSALLAAIDRGLQLSVGVLDSAVDSITCWMCAAGFAGRVYTTVGRDADKSISQAPQENGSGREGKEAFCLTTV